MTSALKGVNPKEDLEWEVVSILFCKSVPYAYVDMEATILLWDVIHGNPPQALYVHVSAN